MPLTVLIQSIHDIVICESYPHRLQCYVLRIFVYVFVEWNPNHSSREYEVIIFLIYSPLPLSFS